MRRQNQTHTQDELDALAAAIQAVRVHPLRGSLSRSNGCYDFYLAVLKKGGTSRL